MGHHALVIHVYCYARPTGRLHLCLTKSAKGPERASHSAITGGRRRYNRLIYESPKSGCGFSPTTPCEAIVDFYYEYRTATLPESSGPRFSGGLLCRTDGRPGVLTLACDDCTISLGCRRMPSSGRGAESCRNRATRHCNWGSASPRSSSGFTRSRFVASGQPEVITASRRVKSTGCFSELEAERRRIAPRLSAGSVGAISSW